MKARIREESGFGAPQAIAGIFFAVLAGLGAYWLTGRLEVKEILEGLQKVAAVVPVFAVAAWHLKLKMMELTGRTGLSLSEQRRLSGIISERTRMISRLIFFYIVTAAILGSAPLIGKIPQLATPAAVVGAAMFTFSVVSAFIILSAFNEMTDFRMMLDRRESEIKERERLLKKLEAK